MAKKQYVQNDKCKIFSVEGNIGSGKSTLLKVLKKYNLNTNIVFVPEPINEWNTIKDKNDETILSKFYKDQEKYGFSFQIMAYISRLVQLEKVIEKNPGKIIITERSLETDKEVFAKMLYDDDKIEEINYQIYLKWFDNFQNKIKPDGLIYLKTSSKISYDRVLKRNREGESIQKTYLENCNKYHDEWIEKYNIRKLIIDGNENLNETQLEYSIIIEKFHNFINE
jgi:deoxyadenosine/deoxycytidine kinase